MFASNFNPLDLKKHSFSFGKIHFFENTPFEVNIKFDPILNSTWLYFGTQNPTKSFQKSISEGIDFLIDFGIDICTVLAPSWDPTWGHVDHFFAQDGGTEFKAPFFFVGSMLFFDLGALMAPSWHHFGLDFGGFGAPFWRFLQGSLPHVRSSKDFSALEKLIEQHTIQNQSHH